MSVELQRPPKPEENQKNSKNFNGKNYTLPGLAVGTLVVLTTAPLGRTVE
jgi:hypothetical protein